MTRQALQAKESAPAKKSSFSWLRPAAAPPAAEAEHEAPSASSPAFAHDFTRVPVRPMQIPGVPGFSCPFAPQRCPSGGACHACPPKLQAKLRIGQPGDQYEQEADRVAETVMRMPEPQVQRKGCSAPGCKEEDEDKKLVQTKPAGGGESRAYVDHPLIQSVLSSPGQPLDAGTRGFMEPRFGQDFSGVRVHVGGQAAESARTVNARAYTVGRDVVFGEGQYAPGSDEGKRLVAHELVHVGQQADKQKQPMLHRKEENNAELAAIQGLPMYELLTRLSKLPKNILADEEAGMFVGGPRLVVAMRAARAKIEKSLFDFLSCNKQGIEALPPNQAVDIFRFMSVPDERNKSSEAGTSIGLAVVNMTPTDKLIEAFNRAKISATVRDKLLSFITPKALVIAILSFAAVFIASQFTPVGWAADISIALTGIFIGSTLFVAINHLINFADARNATTSEEIDQAGAEFAQAVAEIGVNTIFLLVTHGVGGSKGGVPYSGPPPTGLVLARTTEGILVPIVANTIPANVATELGIQSTIVTGPWMSKDVGVKNQHVEKKPKIREEDVTNGPHGPDRPLQDIVSRAWQKNPRTGRPNGPQGRWINRTAGEEAVAHLDVDKMVPGQGYSVSIRNGAGEIIRPYEKYPATETPQSLRFEKEPADRAFVVKIQDEIHAFPIGPEHPAYNTPAPLVAPPKP